MFSKGPPPGWVTVESVVAFFAGDPVLELEPANKGINTRKSPLYPGVHKTDRQTDR